MTDPIDEPTDQQPVPDDQTDAEPLEDAEDVPDDDVSAPEDEQELGGEG